MGIKLYLSGPMSGIADFNRPMFERAARKLRSRGYEVFSPAEGDKEEESRGTVTPSEWDHKSGICDNGDRAFLMRKDFRVICDWAEGIVVLPQWQASRGAKAELLVAQEIELPAWFFQDMPSDAFEMVRLSLPYLETRDATILNYEGASWPA